MKLSNIFEQDPAQAAAMGANVLKKTMGTNTSGAMISKALGKLDQGSTLSGPLAKALSPYADALEKILSDPMYRNRFMQMMKQIQAADNKTQAAQMSAPQESVSEDQDSIDAVAGSITRRIMSQHLDLLGQYGPEKVMAAIDEVADFVGEVDEIGSSDVSGWVRHVEQMLGNMDDMDESDEQLDEILPVLGAMAGRAAFAGAGAVTRGVASMAGRAVGSAAQSALDDNDEDPTDDASNGDDVDTVSMDVPLLLRVLEFAREEVEDDMVLHDIVERLVAMSKEGPLGMDDYESIVGSVEALPAPEEPVEEGYYAPGPETMPGAVGPQDTTTISFNQSKQIGDATLNINASAKDMEELHRILKLAGIDYASNGAKQEPVVAPEPPVDAPCGCDDKPQDIKYSTDKQTLINVLRNKLQKRLA